MHVLVIDDEPALRQVLVDVVSSGGYSVDQAAGVLEANQKLARGDVDVALCDIKMPDGDGIDLLRTSKASGIETSFVMVTAFASVETAVEALRAGAFDYIIKPVRKEEVLNRLLQIEALVGLRAENRALRKEVEEHSPRYRCVSAGMREVERLAEKVAVTDSTVLILGESGTGKGVLARAIHEQSERCERPFIVVNCAAIPDQLMESEFFGHVRGAFTGADRARKGLLLEADRGTLFLDELGELPVHMQTKLLNAIEDKIVRPIGSEQSRRVNVRLVAATNRDLQELVGQGQFREDLFFRLSAFQITIPPLRKRRDDLLGLIRFMLAAHRRVNRASKVTSIDAEAEERLLSYRWPGNVRELKNVIWRACILAEGSSISVSDLPPAVASARASSGDGEGSSQQGELRDHMRKLECEFLLKAIEEAGGDRKLAAHKLGISLSSLYRKLEDIDRP